MLKPILRKKREKILFIPYEMKLPIFISYTIKIKYK